MERTLTGLSRRLENQFFFEKDRILQEELRKLKEEQESAEALSKVSGITDAAVLKELVAHDIRPETLEALCLIPIVEVAWADGTVDEKERAAVLDAAAKNGMAADTAVLAEWLCCKPEAHLMDAWEKYMRGLAGEISTDAMRLMKTEIMAHAEAVARASGAFLGLFSPVSAAERKVLDRIDAVLASV